MSTFSWFKPKKLDKKGMSSVVGALFMILIVGTLASAYFFFTLSQNSLYNGAVQQRYERDWARLSESVRVLDSTYEILENGVVTIHTRVQNMGASPVQLITLWVSAAENFGTISRQNFTKIQVNIQGGETTLPLTYNVNVSDILIDGNYNFAGWFITSSGNSIALEAGRSNSVTFATVSAGIGSIAMGFNEFRTYEWSAAQQNGTLLSSGIESSLYTISNSRYYAIRIALINLDDSGQDIRLTSSSYIWGINPQKGTLKGTSWSILRLGQDNRLYTGDNFNVTLPYGQQTNIYFGISSTALASAALPTVIPLNILLFGQIVYSNGTTTQYGQNLPFVAINIPG